MQVEAIYDNGRVEFTHPLRLRHDRLRVLVEVPDEEIADLGNPYNLPPEVLARAARMRTHLDEIRNAPLPPDDELPPVSGKILERIEAFTLREDH